MNEEAVPPAVATTAAVAGMLRDARLANRSQWREIITEYEASGERVVSFCKSRGLGVRQFYYWRQRLGFTRAGAEGFIELSTKNTYGASGVRVERGEWSISLCKGFDVETLRRVVALLP